MGRLNLRIKFILFLLLTWGPYSALCPIVFGQTTTVSVSPSSITASVNQNFTISVNVSEISAPGLYGWELILTWNSTLLDAVNVIEGPFLKSGGGNTFFTYTLNVTDGSVRVDCTLTGNVNGVNGTGTLATLTFHVNEIGGCPLHLSEATLVDSQDNPIPCTTADGYGNSTPSNGHEIAVVAVDPSKTVVGQGYGMNITIIVEDYGVFSETFNTTAYANTTAIGTQSVSLQSGNSTALSFAWNTISFIEGNYTIGAYASPVPNETDTTNNQLAGGSVSVTIPGDVNGDFKASLQDLVALALAYGSHPGDAKWNPNADIDNNGAVGLSDLVILAHHYGRPYP